MASCFKANTSAQDFMGSFRWKLSLLGSLSTTNLKTVKRKQRMCTLENKQHPQVQKMNVCCPTQTCCGYAPLVTYDQILGAFDSSSALVRCLLNNDPITDIMQLLLWPPGIQTKLLKGTTRGWGPLSGVYVRHSNVWIYYCCGFEIIKSLRIRPPCGSGSSHSHC